MVSQLNYDEFINFIDKFYKQNSSSGYIHLSAQAEEIQKATQEKINLIYGEILPHSINTIITKLNLQENDVFYDLGSGTGKVPLQFFLTTPITKSYGIEAFQPRFNIANEIYNLIKKEYKKFFNSNTELLNINNNFLKEDLTNATVIYTNSLCFSKETMQILSEKLNNLLNLKFVISSKDINLENFNLKEKIILECSWNKGTPNSTFYIYNRKI